MLRIFQVNTAYYYPKKTKKKKQQPYKAPQLRPTIWYWDLQHSQRTRKARRCHHVPGWLKFVTRLPRSPWNWMDLHKPRRPSLQVSKMSCSILLVLFISMSLDTFTINTSYRTHLHYKRHLRIFSSGHCLMLLTPFLHPIYIWTWGVKWLLFLTSSLLLGFETRDKCEMASDSKSRP